MLVNKNQFSQQYTFFFLKEEKLFYNKRNMSAGGLSYSGLRTSAKATLPSVEMWGTNMNILKDPPKSIHTRRIDKVGQTQSVLNAQDQSGDRIAEAINVYARGVNPMVAVSFDNYSNNAGRSSPFQNNKNVSLPYKVTTFRPPIMRQEDLLPLSRLPRNWFYSYTNPSFPDVVQATQCNETGKSVHDSIIHPQASSTKTLNSVGHVSREAPSNSVLNNVPHMQTDAKLFLPQQTYISNEYDTGAEKKSIQQDKMDVVAITNKTSGDLSKQNEFHSLSSGKIGEILSVDMGSAKSFLGPDQQSNFISKDPKQIHWNKKVYEAFTQKSFPKSMNIGDNIDKNKFIHNDKLTCLAETNKSTRENFINPHENTVSTIPTKEYLYNNVRTKATSVFQMPQYSEKSPTKSLNENPLYLNVHVAKQLKGGIQPTHNAVSTISTKPYLYNHVQTQKTSFLTMDNQENNGTINHGIQESLLPSADTSKSFIASKNGLDGSVYEINNEKRTPLHSMQTNTQSPYSMPLLPESIPEQKRSHPLMETSTTKFDPVQIEATRDVYQIQSRNGSKKIHPTLHKGGFEGQGNAVPVFNQYENYNYAIPDQMRQDLRQKTVSIMEGRYDTAPVFS